MTTETTFYTDGKEVTVTDSTLRVRKHTYPLDRIYQHRISVFKPNRTPGLFFVGLGLLSLTAGIGGSSFEFSGFSIHLFSLVLGPSAILIMVGTFLMVGAIGFMVVMKEKYAVHIVMPDEEKDVLVSQRRDYIMTVEDALNRALTDMFNKTRKGRNTMSTSHR